MPDFEKTPINTVRRVPDRGHYDRETVHAIIDEARICHVGFVENGQPFIIPQLHVRVGDELYLHGSQASRLIQRVTSGEPICISCTLLDGLVLARSAFHHSMNYRSVVIFGSGRNVEDDAEKATVFEALVNKVVPGRAEGCRLPNDNERRSTALAGIALRSASAKIRTGPPIDDERDLELSHWAGVLPISESIGAPIPDPNLSEDIDLPTHVTTQIT